MIQRKQSVYLLVAVIVLICALCLPLGYFVGADQVDALAFKPLGVIQADGSLLSTWGVFSLLLLSAVVSFCTIFLFRNRRLQMRMIVFNVVVLVAYFFVLLLFISTLKSDLNSSFQLNWALCLPVGDIILNGLAFGSIRQDDQLVKAADRIR